MITIKHHWYPLCRYALLSHIWMDKRDHAANSDARKLILIRYAFLEKSETAHRISYYCKRNSHKFLVLVDWQFLNFICYAFKIKIR